MLPPFVFLLQTTRIFKGQDYYYVNRNRYVGCLGITINNAVENNLVLVSSFTCK